MDGDKEEGPGTERFARSNPEDDRGSQSRRQEATSGKWEDEAETGHVDGFEETSQPASHGPVVDPEAAWSRVRQKLKSLLGEEVFSSWFESTEFERFDGSTVYLSTATKFLKNWLQGHYGEQMLKCCAPEFPGVAKVYVGIRTMGPSAQKSVQAPRAADAPASAESRLDGRRGGAIPVAASIAGLIGMPSQRDAFEGSPLDARFTFESFVVGGANRLAHAAARQVAETVLDQPLRFNPLYIHSSVGLGKTHLLHAIAWEVRRRQPNAQVLYLTAERFRYHFVSAVRAHDAASFKDKVRSMDVLLIDDLEFLQGPRTELEFDHTLNMLLDGGRQVVVAAARPPVALESLDARLKSRLAGGLVTEIVQLDGELRLGILKRRVAEKRAQDPAFEIAPEILQYLAERLTESGRDLEGAVTRLYASCRYVDAPVTIDSIEGVIKDLISSGDSRRIKIEDILRVVTKHYGVSRLDILSPRRHRSIVWPRQIGMYLAKQLTSRSLPEIGRRFGDRDHTTVLHAIRKVEGEIKKSNNLKDEIEDLKRLLNG
ncbi:MAG: chromosomal replication initiator protein DnaA [Hyphomicrobiaceae bacterium]|nr:MAG: chromosomal replication initiator protein DnaA [Hyphomicrobiaceae bacterium]